MRVQGGCKEGFTGGQPIPRRPDAVRLIRKSCTRTISSCHQIGVGRFHHQMKMFCHQTIRVDLPIGLGAPFTQGLQETLSIGIVAKDWLAAVTTVHEVIDGAGMLDAQVAGHGRTLTFCLASVNKFR